jgi:hypothetical protein
MLYRAGVRAARASGSDDPASAGAQAAAEPFAHAIKIFATCGFLRNGEDFSSFL